MARWLWLVALVAACSGSDGKDTAQATVADTDTDADADADADADGSEEEAEEDSEEDSERGASGGSGSGSEEEADPAVADALRKALSDILAEDDVASELADRMTALDDAVDPIATLPDPRPGSVDPATAEAASVRDALVDVLRDMRADVESGWLRGEPTGRVSARRVATGSQPLTVFDRFAPDRIDETSSAVALIVDCSGSMWMDFPALAQAVWAVHHAAAAADIDLSVLAFGSDTVALVKPGAPAPGAGVARLRDLGGTDPREALRSAYRWLRSHEAANRSIVMMTDGEVTYWSAQEVKATMEAATMEGINTVSVFFRSGETDAALLSQYGERARLGAATAIGAGSLAVLPALFGELAERALAATG